MNRIDKLFAKKKKGILNIYCTAGYPQLISTIEVMQALQNNGADMIEIGMPYSDPLADGPVIQQSNMQALKNGMTIKILFDQLQHLRKGPSPGGLPNCVIQAGVGEVIPVILMGYLNPVLQFGIEKFCAAAEAVGIDGIILPDLPKEEFEKGFKKIFEKHHLRFIFLITPETSEDRIRKIDNLSSGFIYAVSSSSTTGNSANRNFEIPSVYLKKLKDMELKNPVLMGFGIKDKESFTAAAQYVNGAIIGSAYIDALKNTTDIGQTTKKFLNNLLG